MSVVAQTLPARDHLGGGFGWREHAGNQPGDGPVLVALHGIGSQPAAFDALAAALPGWRVIAWDTPGYGASDPLAAAWPLAADYAGALARFVDHLGLTRFHLLGHSLGTLIGAAYARRWPECVFSLTLASCAQGGGATAGGDLPEPQAARLRDLAAEGAEAFARARAPRLVFQPQDNPALVAAVAEGMARVRMPGYGQAVRMLASGDLAADCAGLAVPTAIVVGAEDIVTPPAQSHHAHEALPKAVRGPLVMVPATGHALPQQAPAALAAAIESHARDCNAQQEYRT